ncbi:MAG: S8 family serine peptidase [Panacagrimonas sp.]
MKLILRHSVHGSRCAFAAGVLTLMMSAPFAADHVRKASDPAAPGAPRRVEIEPSAQTPFAPPPLKLTRRARAVPAFTPQPSIEALRADPLLKTTDFSAMRPTRDDLATVIAQATQTEDGRYRVIITLAQRFTPEGLHGTVAAEAQRSGIARLQQQVMDALAGSDAVVTHRYAGVPALALIASERALETLLHLPQIARIEPDADEHPHLEVSVPLIGVADVFDRDFEGAGWTVAVADTGIDRGHPFLRGFVDEACFSNRSDCPNGATTQTGAGAAAACTWSNDCFHGSHVSGIATGLNYPGMFAATGSGGGVFDGVARGATLMPIRVFHQETSAAACGDRPAPCPLTSRADVMMALDYVHSRRFFRAIAAVNLSLGSGEFDTHCDTDIRKLAVDNLRAAGIATVASSGNDGLAHHIEAPACISSVISVGATDAADNVAAFSNSANILDLLAPGVGTRSSTSVPNGAFAFADGTSMAAPHVAGAIALYKDRVDNSVDAIELFLKSTGKPVNDAGVPGGRVTPRIRPLYAMFIANENLLNGAERNHRLPRPNAHEYSWQTATGGYSVLATRPSTGLDLGLTLYDSFNFTAPLATSAGGVNVIDFVALASRSGDFVFPLVTHPGGGTDLSRYSIEQVGPGAIFSHVLTRSFAPTDLVSIADTTTLAFRQEWFRVVPHNGQDLELFNVSAPVEARFPGRGASAAGPGGAEALTFVPTSSQRIGLVVTSRSGSGSYTLYRDTASTVPTVQVSIDGGAATTPDAGVELTLSTPTVGAGGIADMRIAVDGVIDDEAWLPFASSKLVTLPGGPGPKTVAAQVRSQSHAPSPVATDSIERLADQLGISGVDATFPEGDSFATFFTVAVDLSAPATAPVTVDYLVDTGDGTAVAGVDFVFDGGTLNFAPGETRKTLELRILGDTDLEPNETFTVHLSNPSANARIMKDAIVTIADDDLAPTRPAIRINDVAVTEGGVGRTVRAVFTVMLSTASSQTVTVRYATTNGTAIQPGDYTSRSGTLSFAPGTTTLPVAITVKGDRARERNETFRLNLGAPVNASLADGRGVGTITNDD